jgi:hypothetical protein
MTEQLGLYPKLQDEERNDLHKVNYMLDKQKLLKEKLAHYKKIKGKWSVANTVLKVAGISVTCILGGASILTVTPLAIPLAAVILSGVSLGNMSVSNLLVEGFTSRRKRYFKRKCDHVRAYLNKMETFFIKCKEDGQITPNEFDQFQKLLNDFENESSLKSEIKSKDVRKVEKMAQKEIRQQRLNMLYNSVLQEQQQKLKSDVSRTQP